MARKWNEIEADPIYKNSTNEEKQSLKQRYFDKVVTPAASNPTELNALKEIFFKIKTGGSSGVKTSNRTIQPITTNRNLINANPSEPRIAPTGIELKSWKDLEREKKYGTIGEEPLSSKIASGVRGGIAKITGQPIVKAAVGIPLKGLESLRVPGNFLAGIGLAIQDVKNDPTLKSLLKSGIEGVKKRKNMGDIIHEALGDPVTGSKWEMAAQASIEAAAELFGDPIMWTSGQWSKVVKDISEKIAAKQASKMTTPLGKVVPGAKTIEEAVTGTVKKVETPMSEAGYSTKELMTPTEKSATKQTSAAATRALVGQETPIYDKLKEKIVYKTEPKVKKPFGDTVKDAIDQFQTDYVNKFSAIDKYTNKALAEQNKIIDKGKEALALPQKIPDAGVVPFGKRKMPTSTVANTGKETTQESYKITPETNPINLYNKYLGSNSIANAYIDFDLKPLLKGSIVSQSPEALKDFNALSALRRGLSLYKDKPAVLEGMGYKDIKTAVDEMQRLSKKIPDADMKSYVQLHDKIGSYQKGQLDLIHDSGIISDETYAKLVQNKDYIPLKRVLDLSEESTVKGKNFNITYQDLIKEIKGSEKDIINPLESVVTNTYKTINLVNRNNVSKAVANLRLAGDEIEKLIQPTKLTALEKLKPPENVISYYEKGIKKTVMVPDDLAKAMTQLTAPQLNSVARILTYPTKWIRAGATSYNPEFLIPNVARDQWTAYINAKYGYIPAYDFLGGLMSMIRKDKVYKAYMKSGADMAILVNSDRSEMVKKLADVIDGTTAKFLKDMAGEKSNITMKSMLDHALESFQKISAYSEKPTRIGVFKRATQGSPVLGKIPLINKTGFQTAGVPEIVGGLEAREATINFQQIGARMRGINSMVAFLNAREQGTVKNLRTFKDRPVQTAVRAAPIVGITLALSAWNRQFPGYQKVPKFVRDNYFIWMTDNEHFLKLTKGNQARIFANPTEHLLNYLEKNQDAETLATLAASPISEMSPISNFGDIFPSAGRPLFENATNHNFFKNQYIVSPEKQKMIPELQAAAGTSEVARKIAGVANQSPAMIDNILYGYMPGVPYSIMRGLDYLITPDVRRRELKIPGLQRFYGVVDEKAEMYDKIRMENLQADISRQTSQIKNMKYLTNEEKRKLIIKNTTAQINELQKLKNRYK